MNWEELSTTSHYLTAVAIAEKLAEGDVDEASAGIDELIDSISRADRRAVQSYLAILMLHVLKWRAQPEKRSRSWSRSIRSARRAIGRIREDTPSITATIIERLWLDAIEEAIGEAEAQMDRLVVDSDLSWADVFETEYKLSC